VRRGEIYRVHRPNDDPKQHRSFVIVSRQALIETKFSTVVCAPIFARGQALATQVDIGPPEGMKHESWIMCDNLASVRKTELTQFVGSLSYAKLAELDEALRVALALE
jgi:mRNA interferase MazF